MPITARRVAGVARCATLALLLSLGGPHLRAQFETTESAIQRGHSLLNQGRVDEAIAAYQKAIARKPDGAASFGLGQALRNRGRLAEAAEAYRQAWELRPDLEEAVHNLAGILLLQGRLDEAVGLCRQVITRQPKFARAHLMLGTILAQQGKLDEAAVAYRQAIALEPNDPDAHYNLSGILLQTNHVAEGVAACQRSIALRPDFADAHLNLGTGLKMQGKLDAAAAAYRRCIACRADHAGAHEMLGKVQVLQGNSSEAISAFRKVVAMQPDRAEAHCNLGFALEQEGTSTEALAAFRRGHERARVNPGCPYPTDRLVARMEQRLQKETKLNSILDGRGQPGSNRERLEYARLCKAKKLYAASANLYAEAFTADPALAEELQFAHRFLAACAAGLTGTGQGSDFPLDDQERARRREQALAWLKADLALCIRRAKQHTPAEPPTLVQMLSHWKKEPDLHALRDPSALDHLPLVEQQRWRHLWAEVDAHLAKAPR